MVQPQERAVLSRLFAFVWEWYFHLTITTRIRYLLLLHSNSGALVNPAPSHSISSWCIEYEYSFELNKVEILKEKLYYPNDRRSLVFSRDETRGPIKRIYAISAQWFAALWMLLLTPPRKRFLCRMPVRWTGRSQKIFFDISMSVLFWIILDIIRSLSSAC